MEEIIQLKDDGERELLQLRQTVEVQTFTN